MLQRDNKWGLINHARIVKDTEIKNEYEEEREKIDPENFMELKKFVNKYKEKLVIKSKIKLTQVDMLEGKFEKAAREDQIDFDFQNFKDSCLAGTLSGKWDGDECKR